MSIDFEDALKAKKLRNFFHEKGRIYIVVDATSEDVQVPSFLQGDPALRLVLNTRMPQPIYIRDGFVESNFSFSGAAHHCVIPMNRIWAAYVPDLDMESGLIWHESIPETVKMVLDAVDELKPDELKAEVSKPEMKLIETSAASKAEASKGPKGKKYAHLRVVK